MLVTYRSIDGKHVPKMMRWASGHCGLGTNAESLERYSLSLHQQSKDGRHGVAASRHERPFMEVCF
jgi:hypothetical protein